MNLSVKGYVTFKYEQDQFFFKLPSLQAKPAVDWIHLYLCLLFHIELCMHIILINLIRNFNHMLTPVSPSFYFSLDQGQTVTQRPASGVERNIRCESLSISQAIVFKIILMRKYRRVLANNIHCWSGILHEHG